jgi:hypothetical protein
MAKSKTKKTKAKTPSKARRMYEATAQTESAVSERIASALERLATSAEKSFAEVADGGRPNEDPTTLKLTSRKGQCPYCDAENSVLFLRGSVVCGCTECLAPLFEPALEHKLKEKSFIAGAMWAEGVMRLGQLDATREEIADLLKVEIDKRQKNLMPEA